MSKFGDILKVSLSVNWDANDVFDEKTDEINLERPYMPKDLLPVKTLDFLNAREQLLLNQIAANSYFALFALVEEYVIRQVVGLANQAKHSEEIKSFVQFSQEEVKHQALFRSFNKAFEKKLGSPIKLVDRTREITDMVLSKPQLSVMLATYHLELITQTHFSKSIAVSAELDSLFVKILKFHWVEEAQHGQLDRLKLDDFRNTGTDEDFEEGFTGYHEIMDALIGVLKEQAALDVDGFCRAGKIELTADQKATTLQFLENCCCGMFLKAGFEHPSFVEMASQFAPKFADELDKKVQSIEEDLAA